MSWCDQRWFRLQKKLNEDSNEESDKKFRGRFRSEVTDKKSCEDSDKGVRRESRREVRRGILREPRRQKMKRLHWQMMRRRELLEKIDPELHISGNRNYRTPTNSLSYWFAQVSRSDSNFLKSSKKFFKMRGKNRFSHARMISNRVFVTFRESVVCHCTDLSR